MEKILSPFEINQLVQQIRMADGLQAFSAADSAVLEQVLGNFTSRWQQTYQRFGGNPAGELAYRDVILYFTEAVLPKIKKQLTKGGADRDTVAKIELMLSPQGSQPLRQKQLPQNWRQQQSLPEQLACPEFDRPLFIVSAPRAGSTLLFETLSRFEEIWSIGKESHDIEKAIPYLHPATHSYHSNRLTDAPLEVATEVKHWFSGRLQNREKQRYLNMAKPPQRIRFLEKTPKNALRIPFLKTIFPDARFIFLYRNPLENISSLLEGWRSNRFLAYRDMPGWPYKEWHFLLPPGWESLAEQPLAKIASYQWAAANQSILDDLKVLPENDWCFVSYHDLVEQPQQTLRRISLFAELQWHEPIAQLFSEPLPFSSMVISPPVADKWRKHEAEILLCLQTIAPLAKQIELLNANTTSIVDKKNQV